MAKLTLLGVSLAAAVGLLTATAASAWYSPYAFPKQIEAASKELNTSRLERLINYNLVQASLVDSIIANAPEGSKSQVRHLASSIVPLVMTPRTTIQFYTRDQVEFSLGEAAINAKAFDRDSLQRRYVDMNTFEYRVNSRSENNSHNEYVITATRRGVMGWRIERINFKTVEQTVPASSPRNTVTFVRPVPPTFITEDQQVSCSIDNSALVCVNSNDEGMFCDQTSCTYDESGSPFVRGPVFIGDITRNNLRCTVAASSVQCDVRNTSGEVTSEYVEILGDISGARN